MTTVELAKAILDPRTDRRDWRLPAQLAAAVLAEHGISVRREDGVITLS